MSADKGFQRDPSDNANRVEAGRDVLGYIGEPNFAKNEKLNQALIGEPFVTGSSPAGGESIHAKGGRNYQVTAENMDAKLPRSEGYIGEPSSGVDEKRMQSLIGGEAFVTGANPASGSLSWEDRNIGDKRIVSGNLKDNEDGTEPVALGGHYGKQVEITEQEEDFDAAHGHKTDIPWGSGQGSGFDKDWQYEKK